MKVIVLAMLKALCVCLALFGAGAERYSANANRLAARAEQKKNHYDGRMLQFENQLKMMQQRVLSTLQSVWNILHRNHAIKNVKRLRTFSLTDIKIYFLKQIAKVRHFQKKIPALPAHLKRHEGAQRDYARRRDLVDKHNIENPVDVSHKIKKLESLAKSLDNMMQQAKDMHQREVRRNL